MTSVSKNTEFKVFLRGLLVNGVASVDHKANQSVDQATWAVNAPGLLAALTSAGIADISSGSIASDGRLILGSKAGPKILNVSFNNKELGSPRPWALARSLGHSGDGSLDPKYQQDLDFVESEFFREFGPTGTFDQYSRRRLTSDFTDVLETWLGNSAFLTPGRLPLAGRIWGSLGEWVLQITDRKAFSWSLYDFTLFDEPSRLSVTRENHSRLRLDFHNGFALQCRIHTDSGLWVSGKRLPVKLSFELAESF